MEQLLDLYWEGLQRPVHFFPRSAFKFARSGKISDAQQSWHSEFPRGRPESTDFAYRLAFGERVTQMIDQEFEDLAHLVCTPLFDVYSAGVHA